jgi:hypothetical protein
VVVIVYTFYCSSLRRKQNLYITSCAHTSTTTWREFFVSISSTSILLVDQIAGGSNSHSTYSAEWCCHAIIILVLYTADTLSGDQRELHDSGLAVDAATLGELGVIYKSIPIDEAGQWKEEIDSFAQSRGYKNVSVIDRPPLSPPTPSADFVAAAVLTLLPSATK